MINGKNFYVDTTGDISDGYHTFNELYEHRHMLFIALGCHGQLKAWKSYKHHDGSVFDGWFLAGINLNSGTITYHLPNDKWELCRNFEELETAPEWDGHTSDDVLDRLSKFIKEECIS
jgi:hypothetical protein